MSEQPRQNHIIEKNNDLNKFSSEEFDVAKRAFEDRMKRLEIEMGLLFDQAKASHNNPIEKYLIEQSNFDKTRDLFGGELVDSTLSRMSSLTYKTREEFVSRMTEVLEPLLRVRYLDPAGARRFREYAESDGTEYMKAGRLLINIHTTTRHYVLSDGTTVIPGDSVIELFWTDPGDEIKTAEALKETLNKVAEIVAAHPEIKAISTTNWYMDRSISRRMGFEKLPSIAISDEKRRMILAFALLGRKDKGYKKIVEPQDVMFGAMSRNKFLQLWEAKKNHGLENISELPKSNFSVKEKP